MSQDSSLIRDLSLSLPRPHHFYMSILLFLKRLASSFLYITRKISKIDPKHFLLTLQTLSSNILEKRFFGPLWVRFSFLGQTIEAEGRRKVKKLKHSCCHCKYKFGWRRNSKKWSINQKTHGCLLYTFFLNCFIPNHLKATGTL